ncbi:MAG TPA: bifunctional hydroxymethylpyrimidine kinase/phosphomethylpyrimidine kinase [Alphaproteobacteria bacterium]|nr:bifunctional hydroxymethylpyrimidine kinase/phosphomethylpyrimidine kinase [Alphaproteobacteria bacterium]
MRGRVLICAGSDSGGGAGIQADIKTVTMLGGFAATAVTALTAQNTQGVFGVIAVPPPFIVKQMRLVLEDIGADAIKTGMLHSAEVIAAVVGVLAEQAAQLPLVVDPVMVAKGGAPLLEESAVAALKETLIPRATVITPNLPEAEKLCGLVVRDVAGMRRAAASLLALGCRAVLLKGGHLEGDVVVDLLATRDGSEEFESPRIRTRSTHGTGCTLASAIATGLAQTLPLRDAVVRARDYVHRAIMTAPKFGRGHGPLNHAHPLEA